MLISLVCDFCQEVVGWDPITASAKDPDAIDFKEEGRSGLIVQGSLDDFGVPEGDFGNGRGEFFAVLQDQVRTRQISEVTGGYD